jgi:hypothetical protein
MTTRNPNSIPCIGYLAHPFKEWIVCHCKSAHADLFTFEELQFKNDAIQTEESKENFSRFSKERQRTSIVMEDDYLLVLYSKNTE